MILIADSGATKTTWCAIDATMKKIIHTQGISPYFLAKEEISSLIERELLPKLKKISINKIFYYGTGCSNVENVRIMQSAIKMVFPKAEKIVVQSDLMAAAQALCGKEKGVACILGTGSNSCVFNGKKIIKNNPSLGYVLGDEGSGAYLGKKVLQYFIYQTFDEDLLNAFKIKYHINVNEILDQVYKQPFPNRYLASFTPFLNENRGHYMIENIIEDGLSDFFYQHLYKYKETWTSPINFVGSIAYHFRDVLKELCNTFGLQLGKVIKSPMEGLINYYRKEYF